MNTRVIVGIHGLKNKPEPALLGRWWKDSMAEGLRRNFGMAPEGFDFQLAYWAGEMYGAPVPENEDAEPYLPATGGGPLPRHAGSLESIGLALGLEGAGKLLGKIGSAPIADEVVEVGIEDKAPDLHAYYDDAGKREAVRGVLRRALASARDAGQEIMLVSHSMGTIIAYDVLSTVGEFLPGLRVRHFMTLGSPLGLDVVKAHSRQTTGSLRVPECVERWSNFADRKDKVCALDTRLRSDYGPNARGVQVSDHLVVNEYVGPAGKANTHKIYGHLRTPEVSAVIADYAG